MALSREQLLNYAKGNVPGQTAAQQADAQRQLGTSYPPMSTTSTKTTTTTTAPKTTTTTTPVKTTTTSSGSSSGGSSSSSTSAAQQAAVIQAQLADAQAKQAALTKYGLTDTNQIVKSGNVYVPTPQTQAQLDQIASLKSQITQAGGTPTATASSGSLSSQVSTVQAQLADAQAKQAALSKYGLSDTDQIVKSGDVYVPTPQAQAQLDQIASLKSQIAQAKTTPVTETPTNTPAIDQILPNGIGTQSVYQYSDDAFRTLIPQLNPGTPEYEDAMDAVDTSFYDILKAQMTAQTQQEQQVANTKYKELQTYLKNNLGVTLSNNAIQGWEQLQGIRNNAGGQGTTGSGFEAESMDDYLRKVRSSDAASRSENAYKSKGEKQNYYLNYATPAEIKALADSDPATAKAWGLIPSDEIRNSMTPAALKAKYPNMTDEEIARNISMVLDENGNYRSSLYQKYMTGSKAGINTGSIDPSQTIYDANAQDQYGNPLAKSYGVAVGDTGMLDIDAASQYNKVANVGAQGDVALWNAKQKAGVNPVNKSNNADTNNQFLNQGTTSNNIDTTAINKAVSNIQGNTSGSTTTSTKPATSTSTTNGIDTTAISKAISDIQAKTNTIASQVPTAVKATTIATPPATTPKYTGTSIVDYLKSVGKQSDYSTRSNLAAQYGIKNYTGTAQQNTQLLSLMNK